MTDPQTRREHYDDEALWRSNPGQSRPAALESGEFFCTIDELADLARQGLLLLAALCAGLAFGSFIA